MQKTVLILIILFYASVSITVAQRTFPQNGVFDERDGHYAFTNATIYVTPEQKLEQATLIIRKGKVTAVGKGIAIPKDAVTIDLKGKYIYPSFVEVYSNYGMPEPKAEGKYSEQQPQMLSNKMGAYSWNEALKPEQHAHELFKTNAKKAEELRKGGFGVALTHQQDGLVRGTGAVVLLGDEREHELIVSPKAMACMSFNKGVSTQSYPGSLMGVIALLRQTYLDGQWYKANPNDREYNISLEQWLGLQDLPVLFDASDKLNTLRADKLGDEFNVQYIIRGSGTEYMRLDAVKATKAPMIIPIDFAMPYDVSDPYNAQQVSLFAMKHWELAPTNPSAVAKAGIDFALTASGCKTLEEFWANLRKAYQFGLSEKDLLKALTTTPARWMRADKQIGTLETGKIANFFISSTNILSEKATIYHHWVNGKAYAFQNIYADDIRGKYELNLASNIYYLDVKGELDKPELFFKLASEAKDTTKKGTKVTYELENNSISFAIVLQKDTVKKEQAVTRFSGKINGKQWTGKALSPDGTWQNWTANFNESAKKDSLQLPKRDSSILGDVLYPFNAYGRPANQLPKAETILVKGATVWTGESEGVLTETDVLIQNGKIAQIGKNLSANGAKVIDGKGKHLTAGIIDEHSHICINAGVNEPTQSSTAEVRIGDVLNSEDVNMYRQLAGGVTAAQLLHGSANPIGGQSAIIKFRWGSLPEQLKIEGAKPFIKFALGENVKQSNWGDNSTTRFPQTRMGVEQTYEDHFTRAREYGENIKKNGAAKVRRDLDLETLLEILEGKRFITCHSYVQSEITMLMRVADKHKFKVNTFTHILEGFKVADKMKQHGVGASSFADWWAYKYEVMDAIPYNPFILNKMGVVTAINSDDAEMGRRLNQEAAKSVKYGGMTEHDAWKMVTINPAKLLRIDDKVGSVKTGKDADVVLWSDNPLSIYAKPEKTFVDGICLFDIEEDKKLRTYIASERARLIQKMLHVKTEGAKTQPAIHVHERHYHCGDDSLNEWR